MPLSNAFVDSALLMFVLLNPFMMTIYLLDLIRAAEQKWFNGVLIRGALIAGAVFAVFAVTGDAFFRDLLQVRFAAFLLFGGLIFLLVGVRFVLYGTEALSQLRGKPEHVAGSIAMPFMIGPGTVSAAVLAGARLPAGQAIGSIFVAMAGTVVGVILLKKMHDWVKTRHEPLVERYVDIVGRISALVVGTIAVEMIFQGIEGWLESMNAAGV